jgi:hypothetical protein
MQPRINSHLAIQGEPMPLPPRLAGKEMQYAFTAVEGNVPWVVEIQAMPRVKRLTPRRLWLK